MTQTPRLRGDHTLALLREGNDFIGHRCRQLGSDVFRTRLMLRPVTCLSGLAAARMFHEPGRFARVDALPPAALALLQDRGGMHGADRVAHRASCARFAHLLDHAAVEAITAGVERRWVALLDAAPGGTVQMQGFIETLLTVTACDWAGAAVAGEDVEHRRAEFAAMQAGLGSVGPAWIRTLRLRARCERWARDRIRAARATAVQQVTPLQQIAAWRDENGALLSVREAAAELVRLLRPTLAVARYITFALHALYTHPDWIVRLRAGDAKLHEAFAHEVRRLYPAYPMTGGRVLADFEWRGHRFQRGEWVLLDIHGTQRDPRDWEDAHLFLPARFLIPGVDARLVAQGSGRDQEGHRCPGERLTVELMKMATRVIVTRMRFDVPPQSLHIDPGRPHALPENRLRISNVRVRAERSAME